MYESITCNIPRVICSVRAQRARTEREDNAIETFDGLQSAITAQRSSAEVAEADGVFDALFQRHGTLKLQFNDIVDAILGTERPLTSKKFYHREKHTYICI